MDQARPAKKPKPFYLKPKFIAAMLTAAAIIAQLCGVPISAPVKALIPVLVGLVPDDDAVDETPLNDNADDDAAPRPGELPVSVVTPQSDPRGGE